MDKLLLHSCCAPCSVYCVDTLRADGIEPTSLWFNPNIHPWTEYDARRRTLLEYGEKEHVEVHILEDYGLRDFVRAVSADIDHRCAHCYTIRLGTAAKYAADHGYDAFTSSLLISPYQNHELLKAVGETMGKKYGVEFYYRDFRPGFREGQAKAREMGLYMQKYCGCIFSEEDRRRGLEVGGQSFPVREALRAGLIGQAAFCHHQLVYDGARSLGARLHAAPARCGKVRRQGHVGRAGPARDGDGARAALRRDGPLVLGIKESAALRR